MSGQCQNFRLKKMHFPYYFLVKNQWFENLTKGTALAHVDQCEDSLPGVNQLQNRHLT